MIFGFDIRKYSIIFKMAYCKHFNVFKAEVLAVSFYTFFLNIGIFAGNDDLLCDEINKCYNKWAI